MSKITEPMLLDSTGKEIVEKLHTTEYASEPYGRSSNGRYNEHG